MKFSDIRHTLFTVHMWVGLILGVLLAALGLSGSLLVYDEAVADFLVAAAACHHRGHAAAADHDRQHGARRRRRAGCGWRGDANHPAAKDRRGRGDAF